MSFSRFVCRMLALLVVSTFGNVALADELPAGRFADVTLKILTLDRNLPQRVSKLITIAVVSSKASEEKAAALAKAFEERQDKLVSTYRFTVHILPIDDVKKFKVAFNDLRPTCVIALDMSADALRTVSELTREYRAVSIGARKEDANPLSLAFVAERNQIKIYRSDEALVAENVIFPPDFLNITRAR